MFPKIKKHLKNNNSSEISVKINNKGSTINVQISIINYMTIVQYENNVNVEEDRKKVNEIIYNQVIFFCIIYLSSTENNRFKCTYFELMLA